MKKKILLLLLAVIIVVPMMVNYASAANQLEISRYDISSSGVGNQLMQEAMQRWQSYGWNFDAEEIKIYEINPGDFLIAPESAKIDLKSTRQQGGSVKLEPQVMTISPSISSTEI